MVNTSALLFTTLFSMVGYKSQGGECASCASESVAPWYWKFGIPVFIAIVGCGVTILVKAPPFPRRLFVYLLALITAMPLLGIVGTKRLLLISAWAVLPVGICLCTLPTRPWRGLLVPCLLVIAGVGWFGTVTRRFNAAPRFIEPWHKVAAQMAKAVRDRNVAIATHPSFFFYLAYELHRLHKRTTLDRAKVLPNMSEGPQVFSPYSWQEKGMPVSDDVYLFKDVSPGDAFDDPQEYLDRAIIELQLNRAAGVRGKTTPEDDNELHCAQPSGDGTSGGYEKGRISSLQRC